MLLDVVNWNGWLAHAMAGTFQIKYCEDGLSILSQILFHCLTAEQNFVANVRDFLGNHSVDVDYSVVDKNGQLP